jgi:hypothetical protein
MFFYLPKPTERPNSEEESDNTSSIVIAVIAVVLLALIILLVIFAFRRYSKLKPFALPFLQSPAWLIKSTNVMFFELKGNKHHFPH